jgi:hypothetical protein
MLTLSTNSFYFFPKASLFVHDSLLDMIEMYIPMKFQYKPIVKIHLVSGSSMYHQSTNSPKIISHQIYTN